jgi:hypothetical protein
MSKPYHEIMREAMRVEINVQNLIEREVGSGGEVRPIEALAATKDQFVRYVNELQPRNAEAVLRGYRNVFGPMPLETLMCDRLLRMAGHRDASWDFVRGEGIAAQPSADPRSTANIFRLSWGAVLPAEFATLANAIDGGDAASTLWPITCLFRASTVKGHRRLCQVAAQALAGQNDQDTTREGLNQQFEVIREAAVAALNDRDGHRESVAEAEQDAGDEEHVAAERVRG